MGGSGHGSKHVNLVNLFVPAPPPAPDNPEVGKEQWLRIWVPTWNTTLAMGHHYTVPRDGAAHGEGHGEGVESPHDNHGGGANPGGHVVKSGGPLAAKHFSIGDGYSETPENHEKGANQHLRIYVPTEETQISLGEAYPTYQHHDGFCLYTDAHFHTSAMSAKKKKKKEDLATDQAKEPGDHQADAHKPNPTVHHPYNGFSVTTEANIVVSVGGELKIESRSHVIVQSLESSLYAGSPGPVLLGGAKGMYLASPGGVIIHGGGMFGVKPPVQEARSGRDPETPGSFVGAQELCGSLNTFWGIADGIVAALCVSKSLSAARVELKKNNSNYTAVLLALGAMARDTMWSQVALDGTGKFSTNPWGWCGTGVYGDKGLIMTTGLTGLTSVFAAAGFMVGSPLAIFVGAGLKAELLGLLTTSFESKGVVSIGSHGETEVLAKKELELSAREGDLRMDAKHLSFGGGSHEKQQATKTIALSANQVALQSKKNLHLGCDDQATLSAPEVSFVGMTAAIIAAKNEAILASGETEIHTSSKRCAVGISEKKHKVPTVPVVEDGWTQVRGDFYEFKPDKQKDYSDKLKTHVNRVKGIVGTKKTQILAKKGTIEFIVIGKCVAKCDGKVWNLNRGGAEIKL